MKRVLISLCAVAVMGGCGSDNNADTSAPGVPPLQKPADGTEPAPTEQPIALTSVGTNGAVFNEEFEAVYGYALAGSGEHPMVGVFLSNAPKAECKSVGTDADASFITLAFKPAVGEHDMIPAYASYTNHAKGQRKFETFKIKVTAITDTAVRGEFVLISGENKLAGTFNVPFCN